MEYLEGFIAITISILSIGCLIYMVKSDAKSKRGKIYDRIELVEERCTNLEIGTIIAERDYWKKKANDLKKIRIQ